MILVELDGNQHTESSASAYDNNKNVCGEKEGYAVYVFGITT